MFIKVNFILQKKNIFYFKYVTQIFSCGVSMGGFARGVVSSFSFCFGPTYLGLSSFRAWATTNAKNPLNSLGYYWPQKSYDLLHSNNEVVFRRSYLCLISNLLNYMQVEFETVNESYMVHMYFIF